MFNITSLFLYKPIFTVELLIAVFLYSRCLKKKELFCLRMAGAVTVMLTAAVMFPVLGYDAVLLSVLFLSLFLLEFILLYFCYNEPLSNIFFCGIAGYTTQHLASAVYNLIITVTNLEDMPFFGYGSTVHESGPGFWTAVSGIIYIDVYFVIYWLSFLCFGSRIQKNEDLRLKRTSALFLAGLMITSDIVLNAVLVARNYISPDKIYMSVGQIYNIFCCALILFLLFSIISRKKLAKEIDTMHQLWVQQRKQYTIARENIDRINIKCHDLKHQIHQIAEGADLSAEEIKEIEGVISIYDASVKSGNEALDIILTEKSLLCNANNIRITCMADGKKLGFMKDVDIYTLFGNAVDNAIEAVMRLRDPQRRIIGLKVGEKGNFLCIHIYNYFAGKLEMEGDYPETTKEDKEDHGFGFRSMVQIVEKYRGFLTFETEEDIFNLNITFPVEKKIYESEVL